MKQQQTLQPKLRFPEFNDSYKNVYLKDIAKFSKGKNISKADIIEDGAIECIRYGELYTTYGEVIDKIVSKTNLDKKNLVFSEANDIIIPASGESAIDIATASCVIKEGVALGGDLNIIKTKENGVFLSYYFNNKKKYEIAKKSQGISVIHIYSDHLKSLNLNIPSLPEQQKIADYLSTIDTKINLLEEKKAQLALYKKAMMQKLFSQEIRFKDDNGNDFPEWEEKRLGDLGKFGSGTGFSESEQGGKNGIPFIKVSDMNLLGNEIYITRANNYVSDIQVAKNKYKVISKPSIIFAKVGAAIFLERKRIADNFLIDNNMMAFTPNDSILFYYYLFINIRLCKFSQTGALPSYNSSDISTIKVKVPSLTEQQKIADFLLAIDESIEKVTEQISQTQSFKKAMLQQMFV